MRALKLFFVLTVTALRSIPQRLGASLVTVVSITAVIGVLIALLALGEGLESFSQTGTRPDRVVILSNGSTTSIDSSFAINDVPKIMEKPGIRRDSQGKPMASGVVTQIIDGITRKNQHGSIGVFAANDRWLEIWPEVHLLAGRYFQPGLHEMVVSEVIRQRFKGVDIGDAVKLHGSQWTIVGVFKGNGGFFDDALVTDADTVLSSLPQTTYSSVGAILASPASFAVLKQAEGSDPTLKAQVLTDSEANEVVIKSLRKVLDFVSYFIGGFMALGAVCGAVSSLYAAVSARTTEIATLRAIGFGAGPIVGSVLAEGMILAIPAALIGSAVAWALFNRDVVNVAGLTFQMSVTAHMLVVSISWALVIALIGGFLPAIRAATLPVATALRGG